MSKSLFSYLTTDSILYAIVLFLIIWGTLQFNKPYIPFSSSILFLSSLLIFCRKKNKTREKNDIFICLIRIIILGGILFVLNSSHGERVWAFFKIFIIAFLLEMASDEDLKLSKFLFVLYIISNCCLIFYERKTMTVLLWDSDSYAMNRNDITDLNVFRASGFTGHPVLGGFLLSVELAFIQMSRLKPLLKYAFTIILFFALLCINSRFNIVLSAITSLYLFKDAIISKRNNMLKIIIVLVAFIFFYDLIIHTDFGGRLINHESGYNDDSTMARIEVLSFADYLSWNQLLWGDFELSEYLMNVMGLAGIENGYISILLIYGIIFGSILIVLLTIYQWKLLSVYPKEQKIILFSLFFIIANTNPHIANSIPWVYWIVSFYLFRPTTEKGQHLKSDYT